MVDKDKILSIMRLKGPLLPSAISKEIGMDILMSGAVLSELSANKYVKISNIKVGGSPLYYLPGDESRLQDFADKLNEKDKRTYDLLKEKKVLRENVLQPVERVALRQIKDFAMPLKVRLPEGDEIFWKWYLLSNEDAEILIKTMLGVPKEAEPKKVETTPEKVEEPLPVKKPEQVQKTPKPLLSQEKQKNSPVKTPVSIEKKEPIKTPIQETLETQENWQEMVNGDEFMEHIVSYCEKHDIKILDIDVKRKNNEANMTVAIPSSVGRLKYLCKTKNKKRISDADVSFAYLTAEMKKMPLLMLITGELTKKAMTVLDEHFKGAKVKVI